VQTKHVRSSRCGAATRPTAAKNPDRPFEEDLDYKAHLNHFVEVLCWMLPPLLIFGIPIMLGDTRETAQAAYQAVQQLAAPGRKPWLAWLGHLLMWMLKALMSTAASVILRYQFLESQVL
jgi:hypothetical protein